MVRLEDHLQFPFTAKCVALRSTSPLEVGDEVEVVGMAPQEDCEHEMYVYGSSLVAFGPLSDPLTAELTAEDLILSSVVREVATSR